MTTKIIIFDELQLLKNVLILCKDVSDSQVVGYDFYTLIFIFVKRKLLRQISLLQMLKCV